MLTYYTINRGRLGLRTTVCSGGLASVPACPDVKWAPLNVRKLVLVPSPLPFFLNIRNAVSVDPL